MTISREAKGTISVNPRLYDPSEAPLEALRRTKFARRARTVLPTVIAAQSIRHSTTILYFFDGPDTISIHIAALAVVELKVQVRRVTRQLLPELGKGGGVVEARIFVQEMEGSDTSIMRGARISLFRQIVIIAADKWISKLLVPAIIFALTAGLLAGTPSAASALIGMVAALLAFLVEVTLFVYHGNEWLWEEAS